MAKHQSELLKNKLMIGVALLGIDLFGLLFAQVLIPEYPWVTVVVGTLGIGIITWLLIENKKALKSRAVAFGLNSAVTIVLVFGLLGVFNFVGVRYPFKLDLTRNKIRTLSEQTTKIVKSLNKPVKAVLFAKIQQREEIRPLLENYKGLNPKFEVEYVDPDKELGRAQSTGIRKYGTVQLVFGAKDTKVEDANEEKLTNALIKLLKEKNPTLCALVGHGEASFSAQDADGYEAVKKGITNQAYEIKDIDLTQNPKIPDTCDALAILGPKKSFFEPETKSIREYLASGGRAIVALDLNIKGAEYSPELLKILSEWQVSAPKALVVDVTYMQWGADVTQPVLSNFSKDHPVTRDFKGVNCIFPLTRPLEAIAGGPAGLNVQWLAQTTAQSFGVSDLALVAKGQAKFKEGVDKKGPLNVALSVEGKQKDSKATKNTRLVVFGSTQFANNKFVTKGGNLDFFLNAISWAIEDESMISIRTKEEGPGKVELSMKQGSFIFIMTVILAPLLVFVAGLVIWIRRRKL